MQLKRFVCLYLASLCYSDSQALGQSDRLLDAIKVVESGGDCNAVGDGGRAIGPYQIHRAYWEDACQHDPSLRSGRYQDCRDPVYARRVVVAYLKRYAKGKTEEQMARIHNGGPSGWKKAATKGYWFKVKKQMNSEAP